MQMLWLDQLLTSANLARCCGAFAVFAVFITSDLGSELHTGSMYFQTPQQCFLSEGDCFLWSPAPFLFAVLLSLSVSPDLTVANIKALILMVLWLTGAHFPYYLRLFLLNLTVISIIDTHYNFQNCPLLGLWLCFFLFMSMNSSLLCSVKFWFNPFNNYTEFVLSSSKRILVKQNALLLSAYMI